MAIPGIGLASTTQFAPRSVDSNSNAAADKALKNESQSVSVTNSGTQTNESKPVPFTTIPALPSTNKATSSRQDLAELETNRNRFQLQQESKKLEGETGKALQSFIDVADFERKDELESLYGFNIVV